MLQREFFDNINEAYQELIFLDLWKVKFGISNVILSANCTIDATNKSVSEIAEIIMSIINKEDGYFCE